MTIQRAVIINDGAEHTGHPATQCASKVHAPWSAAVALATLFVLTAMPQTAFAEHETWRVQSASYDVYLGVVPANIAERDRDLSRMHKQSPHYKSNLGKRSRHITVAIFRRPGMERVVDAEVNAELVENNLIQMQRTRKSLNARELNHAMTFCNFFKLHWNGKYQVNVRIQEPGRSTEQVTFLQEETDLDS
jgi:hypothetical protein